MQPQGPQLQQNPISASYLDQIATPQKQPGMSNKLFLLIIGGAVALVLIVGVMMLASATAPKTTTNLTTLALRLQALERISKKADKNIKDGQLRSANRNLTTYLINANRDIATPLATNKIILAKAPKTLAAKETKASTDLAAKLEDARLNAVYDTTYAREMTYQLKTVSVLMNTIYKPTKSKSLKTFLEASSKDLDAIYKQFTAFDPTQTAADSDTN